MTTTKPKRHRTGVVHTEYGDKRMLFALVRPDGRLASVIEAASIADAWVIATDWGDDAKIAGLKAENWRMAPAIVEWEDET